VGGDGTRGPAPRDGDHRRRYARLLGLRLIKKTVNFDQPDVYHLYYGDELATPGCVLTFFEFPTAAPGRAGDGMPYRIVWRVASDAALDFWAARLHDDDIVAERTTDASVRFADFEGLEHELIAEDVPDAPLSAVAADIPAEHALQGFAGVRAHGARPRASAGLLDALGFTGADGAWQLAGAKRRARWSYDEPPAAAGVQGAGSIHHVAWSAADDDELQRMRLVASSAGARPTPIIDRQYFHSVYFREPSGVLFELASRDVGFDVDEPLQSLGQALMLPPQYERQRAQLELALTPIVNPRRAA
jgi:glyoxalase family protein